MGKNQGRAQQMRHILPVGILSNTDSSAERAFLRQAAPLRPLRDESPGGREKERVSGSRERKRKRRFQANPRKPKEALQGGEELRTSAGNKGARVKARGLDRMAAERQL